MKIERTLSLEGAEYDTINAALKIISNIWESFDSDEELIADRTWSSEDVRQVYYFLDELTSCSISIERKKGK